MEDEDSERHLGSPGRESTKFHDEPTDTNLGLTSESSSSSPPSPNEDDSISDSVVRAVLKRRGERQGRINRARAIFVPPSRRSSEGRTSEGTSGGPEETEESNNGEVSFSELLRRGQRLAEKNPLILPHVAESSSNTDGSTVTETDEASALTEPGTSGHRGRVDGIAEDGRQAAEAVVPPPGEDVEEGEQNETGSSGSGRVIAASTRFGSQDSVNTVTSRPMFDVTTSTRAPRSVTAGGVFTSTPSRSLTVPRFSDSHRSVSSVYPESRSITQTGGSMSVSSVRNTPTSITRTLNLDEDVDADGNLSASRSSVSAPVVKKKLTFTEEQNSELLEDRVDDDNNSDSSSLATFYDEGEVGLPRLPGARSNGSKASVQVGSRGPSRNENEASSPSFASRSTPDSRFAHSSHAVSQGPSQSISFAGVGDIDSPGRSHHLREPSSHSDVDGRSLAESTGTSTLDTSVALERFNENLRRAIATAHLIQSVDVQPDSMLVNFTMPSRMNRIVSANLQPIVRVSESERRIAEEALSRRTTARPRHPGTSSFAEDSPEVQSTRQPKKRFMRYKASGSSVGKHPSEIYGSVFSYALKTSMNSQSSWSGLRSSQSQDTEREMPIVPTILETPEEEPAGSHFPPYQSAPPPEVILQPVIVTPNEGISGSPHSSQRSVVDRHNNAKSDTRKSVVGSSESLFMQNTTAAVRNERSSPESSSKSSDENRKELSKNSSAGKSRVEKSRESSAMGRPSAIATTSVHQAETVENITRRSSNVPVVDNPTDSGARFLMSNGTRPKGTSNSQRISNTSHTSHRSARERLKIMSSSSDEEVEDQQVRRNRKESSSSTHMRHRTSERDVSLVDRSVSRRELGGSSAGASRPVLPLEYSSPGGTSGSSNRTERLSKKSALKNANGNPPIVVNQSPGPRSALFGKRTTGVNENERNLASPDRATEQDSFDSVDENDRGLSNQQVLVSSQPQVATPHGQITEMCGQHSLAEVGARISSRKPPLPRYSSSVTSTPRGVSRLQGITGEMGCSNTQRGSSQPAQTPRRSNTTQVENKRFEMNTSLDSRRLPPASSPVTESGRVSLRVGRSVTPSINKRASRQKLQSPAESLRLNSVGNNKIPDMELEPRIKRPSEGRAAKLSAAREPPVEFDLEDLGLHRISTTSSRARRSSEEFNLERNSPQYRRSPGEVADGYSQSVEGDHEEMDVDEAPSPHSFSAGRDGHSSDRVNSEKTYTREHREFQQTTSDRASENISDGHSSRLPVLTESEEDSDGEVEEQGVRSHHTTRVASPHSSYLGQSPKRNLSRIISVKNRNNTRDKNSEPREEQDAHDSRLPRSRSNTLLQSSKSAAAMSPKVPGTNCGKAIEIGSPRSSQQMRSGKSTVLRSVTHDNSTEAQGIYDSDIRRNNEKTRPVSTASASATSEMTVPNDSGKRRSGRPEVLMTVETDSGNNILERQGFQGSDVNRNDERSRSASAASTSTMRKESVADTVVKRKVGPQPKVSATLLTEDKNDSSKDLEDSEDDRSVDSRVHRASSRGLKEVSTFQRKTSAQNRQVQLRRTVIPEDDESYEEIEGQASSPRITPQTSQRMSEFSGRGGTSDRNRNDIDRSINKINNRSNRSKRLSSPPPKGRRTIVSDDDEMSYSEGTELDEKSPPTHRRHQITLASASSGKFGKERDNSLGKNRTGGGGNSGLENGNRSASLLPDKNHEEVSNKSDEDGESEANLRRISKPPTSTSRLQHDKSGAKISDGSKSSSDEDDDDDVVRGKSKNRRSSAQVSAGTRSSAVQEAREKTGAGENRIGSQVGSRSGATVVDSESDSDYPDVDAEALPTPRKFSNLVPPSRVTPRTTSSRVGKRKMSDLETSEQRRVAVVVGDGETVASSSKNAAAASSSRKKTGQKAAKQKVKKDLAYYMDNTDLIKTELVQTLAESQGIRMSRQEVQDVTAHMNNELKKMLDELQARTLRHSGMFSFRELESGLRSRGLLYNLGRNELLVYFADFLNRSDFKRCQGVLIPKGSEQDTPF